MPILVKPLAYITLAKTLLGFGAKDKTRQEWKSNTYRKSISKTMIVEERESFGKEFDEFYEDARKGFLVSVVRDSAYLNWRYLKKPEEKYRILTLRTEDRLRGYIVLKLGSIRNLRTGLVMDLLTRNPSSGEEEHLLRSAIDIFKLEGAALISVLCFPISPYHRKIKGLGFRKLPKRILKGSIHFGARLNSSEFNVNSVFNPKGWLLGWGDTDIF